MILGSRKGYGDSETEKAEDIPTLALSRADGILLPAARQMCGNAAWGAGISLILFHGNIQPWVACMTHRVHLDSSELGIT